MKKSFNVNLGGRIFQIDEDAYEQLNDYLVSVRTCFMNNECGEEIAADIEARIGELFVARVGDGGIVTLALVNEMIARVGKPESMVDEDEMGGDTDKERTKKSMGEEFAERAGEFAEKTEEYIKNMSMGKKLFRDGDNKMIAGVVSGLALYFNINVTLLRVIAVFLIFVTTFWAFLLYLVLWAIVPLAITTTDKLRMQGVEPTPENIAERLTYEEPAIDKIVRNLKEVDNKGITTLLIILGCVLFLSMFIFGVNMDCYGFMGMIPVLFVVGWIGIITAFAIPVTAIVLVVSKRWNELSSSVIWLMLMDWVLSLVLVSRFSMNFTLLNLLNSIF